MMKQWNAENLREWIAVPTAEDDKYSRGVLGIVTGSELYPGAAVLGVEAAARTGVGMIRYLGSKSPTDHVLRRRPEVVTVPGRVQAWLLGSGMAWGSGDGDDADSVTKALSDTVPLVVDAGVLDRIAQVSAPTIITPHYSELAKTLTSSDPANPVSVSEISSHPATWATRAAQLWGVTVLLKGHTTHVVSPSGEHVCVHAESSWLATAGSGDVLGGILGALVATHAEVIREGGHEALTALAASAAWIHARAGMFASNGGPMVALDIAEAVPVVIRELLSGQLLFGGE